MLNHSFTNVRNPSGTGILFTFLGMSFLYYVVSYVSHISKLITTAKRCTPTEYVPIKTPWP